MKKQTGVEKIRHVIVNHLSLKKVVEVKGV